jgi:hypothetical protein
MYWLSLLLIPAAIALMDIFLDKAVSILAPSSQHQLHELLNRQAASSPSSPSRWTMSFWLAPEKFVEKETVRGLSGESFGSAGYNPEKGVKLSTTPSDDGSWLRASR